MRWFVYADGLIEPESFLRVAHQDMQMALDIVRCQAEAYYPGQAELGRGDAYDMVAWQTPDQVDVFDGLLMRHWGMTE
jgi:hypothetical protein